MGEAGQGGPPGPALPRVQAVLAVLPPGLRAHVERARAAGAGLARAFGVDPARADLALAAHDLFRAKSRGELLAQAKRRGLPVDAIEREQPMLLHGAVAAAWLSDEGGVEDPGVLDAVRHHTTFAPGLGALEAAVFLADKLDPDKVSRRPWLAEVGGIARAGDWRGAVAAYLRGAARELAEAGVTAHPRAAEALEALGAG